MARNVGTMPWMAWVYAIHRWTGMLCGWLLLVICLTGTLVVYKHALKAWANPTLVNAPASAAHISPDEALQGFLAHSPDVAPKLLAFPSDAYSIHSYSYRVPTPEVASGRHWMNPVTGEIHEGLPSDFADFVQDLHASLWMGLLGRWLVGVLGVLMGVSLLSGLVFHWKRLRRDLFHLRLAAAPRKAWGDLHKASAVWLFGFHLIIAVTGAWLGLESLFALRNRPPVTLVPETAQPIQTPALSVYLAQAQAAFPEQVATHMNFSAHGQADSSVRVQGDLADVSLVQRGQSMVVMQAQDARVIDVVDRRDEGLVAQLLAMARPLHYGYFAGPAMLLAYWLMGAACTAMVFSGLAIWATRTADRQHRQACAADAKWHTAPWMARVNVGVCMGLLIATLLAAHLSHFNWTPLGQRWLDGAARFIGSRNLIGRHVISPEVGWFFGVWIAVAIALAMDRSTRWAWALAWAVTSALLLSLPFMSAASSSGFATDWQRGHGEAFWIALACWALGVLSAWGAWRLSKQAIRTRAIAQRLEWAALRGLRHSDAAHRHAFDSIHSKFITRSSFS